MPASRSGRGDDDASRDAPRAVPPRGRRREARFELEFGDFEPAERTGSRTRGTVSDTYEPVDPLPPRRRRAGTASDDSGTYDARSGDRTGDGRTGGDRTGDRRRSGGFTTGRGTTGARDGSDPVVGEIEALERFEDAIETVRSPSDRGGGSDLGARVLVAIPAGLLAIFLVAQGGPVFVAGILIFAMIGVWELTRMFAKTRPSLIAGGVGVAGVILAGALGDRDAMLTALTASIPIVFLFVGLGHPRGSMPGVAVTMLGVAWIGLALGHAVLLRDSDHGGGIVVDVLIGTFLGDTGAYLGGRMFGSRKLWPRVSPNKTVEGLVIGLVTAVAATWFAGLYQDWLSGTDALLLGLAVAVAAPLGDLFESFLKRDAKTKDAGGLFGVHGGVLDRLDAAMFAIVAGYYVWLALGGV
jgi:phosphatidate cytidylyltransferase